MDIIPGRGRRAKSFLEWGCWDGMVCVGLHKRGMEAAGIDLRPVALDRRLVPERARFLPMGASRLAFKDESFDWVYSYAGFERFSDPEEVLREALRVTRLGGRLFSISVFCVRRRSGPTCRGFCGGLMVSFCFAGRRRWNRPS